MLNAVMLVRDRPLLTHQALVTFLTNSRLEWTLTLVDDCSHFQTRSLLDGYKTVGKVQVIHLGSATNNTAMVRNLGVYWSEHYFGRGEALYLSDNDAYFTEGWDDSLMRALSVREDRIKLIGPYRHPYHHANGIEVTLGIPGYVFAETDAVQGIGHLMRWPTWDKYGPLKEHIGQGMGTNQSEDYDFCRKIVDDGYLVGSIQPNVVYNCGITGTNGKPSPGADLIERVKGVYYE